MISVNELEVKIEHYPDGTPRINLDVDDIPDFTDGSTSYIHIRWKYENDAELMYLTMIKKHLDANLADVTYLLTMDYIPNGRMDRTKRDCEVFTLKYFCDVINSLNFSRVFILDAHSNVSVALLNNCINKSPKNFIQKAIDEIRNENIEKEVVTEFSDIKNDVVPDTYENSVFDDSKLVLYFPDYSAAKRYSDMFPQFRYCYGEKKRDWETGKILGIDIRTNGIDLENKIVLVLDDLISYGGSIHYGVQELINYKPEKVYAYATHCENSVLDKEKGTLIKDLENNTVERLFTTDSLFTGKHEKIKVMEVY
ncbi:phosphoribosyltransferase family protein [Eubacterium ramulus]|uniref:phosphoribosyltransferase family protein n=1 Tax=Eubacterium ramulus TaxID=39490 RepID=UPI00399BE1DF